MLMGKKPTTAFVLSLVGGIIICLIAIFISFIGTLITSVLGLGGSGAIIGLFGITCSVAVMVGAIMLYNRPQQHLMWSIIVIVFSILSWFNTAGGLFLGLILGVVGRILGIIWKPSI